MKLKGHNIKRIIRASSLALCLFGLGVAPIVASELTFADTCAGAASDTEECLTVKVTVPEVLAITNAASIPSEMLISNTTGLSASQEVIVKTNCAGGYILTAKAISTNTSGTVSNSMLRRDNEGTALSNNGINSLSAKSTFANMGNNTWGLSVDGTYFRPVATTASGSGIIAYSTAPVSADTTNMSFAAKGQESTLVSGTYSAKIQLTAIKNESGTAQTLYGD